MKFYILVLGAFTLLLCSCKKDKDPQPLPETSQIDTLYATDFEINNIPDISGWILFYDYYSGVQYDTIVSSTCPNGGQWALAMKAQKLHSSYAERYLTNYSGTKYLSLSFYATLYAGQNSVTASLSQIRNGAIIQSKEINLGIWNNWYNFNIRDTLNLLQTDSIRIKFKGTGSTYESSDFRLDRVLIEEL